MPATYETLMNIAFDSINDLTRLQIITMFTYIYQQHSNSPHPTKKNIFLGKKMGVS